MKNKILILFILSGLAVSSCNKKLDDAYANPNFPVKVPVETILPPMIANMHRAVAFDSRFINRYIQNLCITTASDDWERHGYQPGSDNGGEIWRIHYWNFGINTLDMINWGREEQKWDYVGAGYACFAWSWLTLTDCHGEVILKEAFKRDNLTFKYDPQADVYDYVKVMCDSAEFYLSKTDGNASAANFLLGDKYFLKGDRTKWLKFVNGIRARVYHRITNKSTYDADKVINYCNQSLASVDDDCMISFEAIGTSNTSNFFGPIRQNFASYRQSSYIVDLMNGANPVFSGVSDPRKYVMLRPNNSGVYLGVTSTAGQASTTTTQAPNVWGAWNSSNITQDTGRYLFRNGALWPVMTYSEIQFMKAEALFRKGDKPGALAAYKEGIKAHFDMIMKYFPYSNNNAYTMTTSARDAFLADPNVVPTNASNLTLSQIMLQKYISLWVWGCEETWVDMRRYHYNGDNDVATGFPVYRNFNLPTTYYPANNNKPAYRLRPRYNSEYIWNLNEVSAVGGNNPDYHTYECWFSKP